MQRKLGADIAKALRRRVAELRAAQQTQDLLAGTGKWEELTGDRRGQWSARLAANWRLIIEEDTERVLTVVVIEIVDYHRK